jgi:hypothetical protein
VTFYPLLAVGDRVGSYQIVGALPPSGYRAIDDDGTRVHLDVTSADDWRERALQHLRASQIAGSLEHAGIARIVGRGVLPDRRPWIASELADGMALSEVLARRRLTVAETVELVRDLAEIVAHAHARKIVHGAIRPHLIVLRTGERAFPIQLGGWGDLELGDAREADLHAIGAIAYRALAGKPPAAIPALIPGVPAAVGALVLQLLAGQLTALEALVAASRLCGDRARAAPRIARPRWTPAPVPDGERIATVLDLANHRTDRD